MAMSRKHYRAFADILAQARRYFPEAHEALDHVTRGIAGVCKEDNRAFRTQQFYDAAQPEESP